MLSDAFGATGGSPTVETRTVVIGFVINTNIPVEKLCSSIISTCIERARRDDAAGTLPVGSAEAVVPDAGGSGSA